MRKWSLLLPALALVLPSFGQTSAPEIEIANLREDIRGLNQRMSDLTLRMEQLEAENGALREKVTSSAQAYATVAQLNDAIATLNRAIQTSVATAKDEAVQQFASQASAARLPSAPAESASRGPGARAASAGAFSDDFPKEGVKYTVQKGDTIALVAKKTGAKMQDIINANRISDPSRILVGQTLFIPGGK